MKLLLGYLLLFVFGSGFNNYETNGLGQQISDEVQYNFSLDNTNATVSPYHPHVHYHLGVDFQEKNEKFKKFHIPPLSALVNLNSYPPEDNKFDSFYFSIFITPTVSKHILFETFLI